MLPTLLCCGLSPVQLLLVDKLYFRVMRGWIRRNLRKQIAPHRHVSEESKQLPYDPSYVLEQEMNPPVNTIIIVLYTCS